MKKLGLALVISWLFVLGAATADAQFVNRAELTLWAGQYTNAGTVLLAVEPTCAYLRVRLIPENGWEITEYHVAVVSEPANFPMNGPGNPIPGQFQWSASFPPTVDPLNIKVYPDDVIDPIVCGDAVYVAVHAIMVMRDEHGNIIEEETAWAGPCVTTHWDPHTELPEGFFEFPGPRWDFYTEYVWSNVQGLASPGF
jgi:hypothetical protein